MDRIFEYGGALGERRRNRYAVVILLPQALHEIVAPLRERFDPLYNLVAPHITVVFPFETNLPLDELAGLIKTETDGQKSFQIQLDSIGDFYPGSPTIYWNVLKNDHLTELYYRLYSRLGIPLAQKLYQPHVTVAREISEHRLVLVKEQIASYLPREKFFASSLDLMTPLVNERWVSVRTFPFKGFSDNPPMI
ncbi:MAG: 2'-5' RNA ligase family protein [Candidatus Zixiibacteriota bacterium]